MASPRRATRQTTGAMLPSSHSPQRFAEGFLHRCVRGRRRELGQVRQFPYDLAFGLSLGALPERAGPARVWKRQLLDPTPYQMCRAPGNHFGGGGVAGRSFSETDCHAY
jgi:hypothetical protein